MNLILLNDMCIKAVVSAEADVSLGIIPLDYNGLIVAFRYQAFRALYLFYGSECLKGMAFSTEKGFLQKMKTTTPTEILATIY